MQTPVQPIFFSSNDFLSQSKKKPLKKRKSSTEENLTQEKNAKKSKKIDSERGQMTIFTKSEASVASEQKEKEKKKGSLAQKGMTVANSLSVNIKDGKNLLIIDEKTVFSCLLNNEEHARLQNKKQQAKKKYGEEPSIVKLQWQERESATLVGIYVPKKTNFKISSKLTEPQSFSVDSSVWIASQDSVAKIALCKIDGSNDVLAIVPDYKGVVRVTLDASASGTFGLVMVSK